MSCFLAQMRKNTLKILHSPAQNVNRRVIYTKSNQTSSSPPSFSLLKLRSGRSGVYSNSNGRKSGENGTIFGLLEEVQWKSCGIVVVGSSLGLVYLSFFYNDGDSIVCYADSGSASTVDIEKKPKFIFKDAYRRRVFFKYEKRLRTQSPPAKVFEYFASYRSGSGEVFMTPADLMRAVVPVFPPSEAGRVRGGFLKGEPIPGELYCAPSQFFMLFDTNGDGLISFVEYIFFVTLLSIPETSFSVAFKMFDLDNDGGIDKQEFKKVMGLMRRQSKLGDARTNRDGVRFGLKAVTGSPVEDGGLLEYFFGKDGHGRLELEKFTQFLKDLHHEIMRLEFAHYDCKSRGTISAKDFALSMVASADMSHINKFLDRVDELDNAPDELKSIRINFEEFKSFAELRKTLQPFSLAIFSYGKANGLLTKDDLQRAASQVCGVTLTKNIIEMIFYMFDENCDGNLSSTEFLRVLQQKESQISQTKETGFAGLFSCWAECTKSDRGTFKLPL